MKILLHISFLGTRYCGYQVQPNGVTVQQRLNEAAEALFGTPCDIVGCSRTDSGVHAREFCAAVTRHGGSALETTVPIDRMPEAFSRYLPEDIAVFAAEWVPEKFHPRYDVRYKEYEYRIRNARTRDPFETDRAWHCPRPIEPEGLCKMRQAAEYFCGAHDFTSFMAASSGVENTVRCVYTAEVEREGDTICFRVSADGFLYHMVRIMTGTLAEVAYGRLEPQDIPAILAAQDRRAAGPTAPAHGLYLNRVVY